MSKEMYAAPELEVVDLGGEDVICSSPSSSAGGTGTDTDTGDWENGD